MFANISGAPDTEHVASAAGKETEAGHEPPVLSLPKVCGAVVVTNDTGIMLSLRNEIESQIRQVDREIQQYHDQFGPGLDSMSYGKLELTRLVCYWT